MAVGRVVEVAGWVPARGKGRASITSLRGGRLEAGWPHSLKSQKGEFERGPVPMKVPPLTHEIL